MAPLTPSSTSVPPWKAANEELTQAERMLDEASPPLTEVARHLCQAWTHLWRAYGPAYERVYGRVSERTAETAASTGDSDDEDQRHEAVAQMAGLLNAPVLAGQAAARRLVFGDPHGASAEALSEAPAVRQGLQLEAAAIRHALEEVSARRDGSAWVGLGLGFLVLVLVAFAPLIGDIGGTVTTPWRGLYYDNDKFEGTPRERSDRLLSFDFGREPPIRGISKDRFSIRWDTCLRIEEEGSVRFQLSSDDGSRLYVDGEKLIDNWGDHGTKSKSGRLDVEPGVYYLEVEYYEAKHGANVKLEMALGTDKLEVVPVDMIQAPGDGEDPCEGAAAE